MKKVGRNDLGVVSDAELLRCNRYTTLSGFDSHLGSLTGVSVSVRFRAKNIKKEHKPPQDVLHSAVYWHVIIGLN